jgi:rhodanese-related sulfurtransferase
MKVNLKICLVIILVSIALGLTYNTINPGGINLFSHKEQVSWASDSLLSSTLNNKRNTNKKSEEIPLTNTRDTITQKVNITSHSQKQPNIRSEIKTEPEDGFKEPIAINLQQAYKLYQIGIIFLDARELPEYQTGHIKNSINLPVYDFDKHKNILEKISKSETIICYCGGNDCDLSTQLAKKLFSLGYRNNYIFVGGWEQWKSAGYASE